MKNTLPKSESDGVDTVNETVNDTANETAKLILEI